MTPERAAARRAGCCVTGRSCSISSGRGFSRFAAQMATVALGWQVYAMTDSAFDLGLIGLAQFLPMALLVFVAGHAADRYDRQRVVQVCQIAQALAAALPLLGQLRGLADGAGDLWRGGAARGRHRLRVAGDRGAPDRRGAAAGSSSGRRRSPPACSRWR